MRAIDLTGQRFGKLLVIERAFPEGSSTKNALWLCQCDCGNIHVASRGGLRKGDTKHCGCVPKVGLDMDISGKRYGECVAISKTQSQNKAGNYVWEFLCDCGETFFQPSGNIIFRGQGCCEACGDRNKREAASIAKTTHGMSDSKEYKSWTKIRERVFDKNCKEYQYYGAIGIQMYEHWRASFEEFYSHIGPMPTDGRKYTCDRIDNDGDYVPGNVQWALPTQQARNKGKMKNNTSGYTGVAVDEKSPGKFYAKAQWQDLSGKLCTRSFSFKTYGEELAMLCAIEARDQAIRLLNQQGAGYSSKHGL